DEGGEGAGVLAAAGPGPPASAAGIVRYENVGLPHSHERGELLTQFLELRAGTLRELHALRLAALEGAADRTGERGRDRLRQPGPAHRASDVGRLHLGALAVPVHGGDLPAPACEGDRAGA